MKFTQQLTKEDFERAFALHDKTFRWRRARPLIGLIFMGLGISWLFIAPEDIAMYIYIAVAVYFLLANKLYRMRLIRNSLKDKTALRPLEVEIAGEGLIKLNSERGKSETDISKLHGYLVGENLLLLYMNRFYFYVFKRDEIERAGGFDSIISIFESSGLTAMKR